MNLSVGVVGAGLVGLSTAINIQRLIKHVHVTVIAETFGEDTLKTEQMGIFLPVPERVKGVNPVTVQEWLIDSYKHHKEMAESPEGIESGQQYMTGTCRYTYKTGHQNIPLQNLVKDLHHLSEEDKAAQKMTWPHVCSFQTVVVDQLKYIRWLMKEFREHNGTIQYRIVNALQELYGLFDVVVNCTGRHTREQVIDPYFGAHHSRTVQVSRELPKKFILDDNLMAIPHLDSHLWDLSWTTEPKDTDVIIDDNNARLLMHVAKARLPQFEGCDYIREWEQHTSWREPPMVEIELIRCVRGQGPYLPVVHNVGHGCDELTLAWGTGAYAAHLVQDCQRMAKPFIPVRRPMDPRC